MAKTQPCKFTFDNTPAFDGFALGSTWNGFDNVSVTPAVRDQIVAYFTGQGDDEAPETFNIETGEDGLVCLGWGFSTQIVIGCV